jgi:hypothetical protein
MLANSRRKSKKSWKARSADTEPTNIARVCNDKPVTIMLVGALRVKTCGHAMHYSVYQLLLCHIHTANFKPNVREPDSHLTDDKDHRGSPNRSSTSICKLQVLKEHLRRSSDAGGTDIYGSILSTGVCNNEPSK